MLWLRIFTICLIFIVEIIFKFNLTTDSITTITTFFSIASGAYLTVLVVLFGSKVSVKLNYQQQKGTGHSTLDELCNRLQNSLIICLSGLFIGFVYSCIPCKILLKGVKFFDCLLINISFLFTFFVSIIFVLSIEHILKTAQYLIVLLKSESKLNS